MKTHSLAAAAVRPAIRRTGVAFVSVLLAGCIVNRLAPPEESFVLEYEAVHSRVPMEIKDARTNPPVQSQTVQDGFIVGDGQLQTSPPTYVARQLAQAIASHEFADRIRPFISGKPLRLVVFNVAVSKGPAQTFSADRYNHVPPGQALFNQGMDAFGAELARPKWVTVRVELEVGDQLYFGQGVGSYSVVPTNGAVVSPAAEAISQLAQNIANGATGASASQ